jgi:hypothetical protein
MHELQLFIMNLPSLAICTSVLPFYNDQFDINTITPEIYSMSLAETTQHSWCCQMEITIVFVKKKRLFICFNVYLPIVPME